MVNQFKPYFKPRFESLLDSLACIDLHLDYFYNVGKKVRIYPPKDQKKVCLFPKIWSEKSQNFLHFCQNPIVGALANASDKYILSFISVCSFDGPEGVKNMKGG